MKCRLLMSSTYHLLFLPFWPIRPILAWADWPVFSSHFGLREERKKVLDRQVELRECVCRKFQKVELNDS